MNLLIGRKFNGDHLIDVLIDLFAIRGVPTLIWSDNGPSLAPRRVRGFRESIDVCVSYIEPRSPRQDGLVDSFGNRFRDECLNGEKFATVQESRVFFEHRRQTYDGQRPHGSLAGTTPPPSRHTEPESTTLTCSRKTDPSKVRKSDLTRVGISQEKPPMKKSKFTDQQIPFALKQAEPGTQIEEVCGKLGISQQTFSRWKKKFAGLGTEEFRRLKQLEEENKRLKSLVADPSLDK